MRERTARLLFLVGMLLSFPAILAVTLVVRSGHAPAGRVQGPRSAVAAVRPKAHSTPRQAPSRRPPEGRPAPEHGSPAAAPAGPADGQAAAASATLATATVEDLAATKRELRQEIESLKGDRDALIAAFAQSLARLAPEEAAAQLAGMDADGTARTLSYFGETRRQQILARLPAAAAREARQRLEQLPPH